jgi:dCMP deaminase
MSKLMEHNRMLMEISYRISLRSTDPHRKVGAVIARGTNIISYGWNGTPTGFPNNCKDNTTGRTLPIVIHAEANAIAKAAQSTETTKFAAMYSTTVPCIECAKLIIQSGITTVFYAENYNKCNLGKELLQDCNIKLIKLEV